MGGDGFERNKYDRKWRSALRGGAVDGLHAPALMESSSTWMAVVACGVHRGKITALILIPEAPMSRLHA